MAHDELRVICEAALNVGQQTSDALVGDLEKTCTCTCEMCAADDPDHWGCDRQEHEYSFDGRAPCETDYDPTTCWAKEIDQPLIECTLGIFPEDAAPWPVTVRYLGDGEVEIRYAPPSEVAADDGSTSTPSDGGGA